MGGWYQDAIVDSGRAPLLWAILGFIITFALTRFITARIQRSSDSRRTLLSDIYIGGVHVHHQVWGMLLVLLSGLFLIRYQPGGFWLNVLATTFGIGAALMLDEFASSLYLDDVYWTAEGRKSIDAVVAAVVIGAALLVGTSAFNVAYDEFNAPAVWATALLIALHVVYTVLCLLKGKIATGVIGFLLPVVGIFGAVRLAKPSSFWAQRYYRSSRGDLMDRAEARFAAGRPDPWDRVLAFVRGDEHAEDDGERAPMTSERD